MDSLLDELRHTTYDVLRFVTASLKDFEKHTRRLFPEEFETAFAAHGGRFQMPTLHSPSVSDNESVSSLVLKEDDIDSSDAPTEKHDIAGINKGDGVTQRDAYGAVLMDLLFTLETLAAMGMCVKPLVKRPVPLEAMVNACTPLLQAVRECHHRLYSATAPLPPGLADAVDASACEFVSNASMLARRTQAQQAWLKLRSIGEDAAVKAVTIVTGGSPAQATPSTAAAVAPSSASVRQASPHPPSAAPPAPAVLSSTFPHNPLLDSKVFATRYAFSDHSDDDSTFQLQLDIDTSDYADPIIGGDATLPQPASRDGEAEVEFHLPRVAAASPTPKPSVASPGDALFDQSTMKGRRNLRAQKLIKGLLCATGEDMTAERTNLIQQTSSLRDLLAVFGTSDYNLLMFQMRTLSQQIGETGPLLWTAALDICVSYDYANEPCMRRVWLDERVAAAPPEPSEPEKYVWVELLQSEPCIRGTHAKQQILAMGAKMLLPREFEVYRRLSRDDVYLPEAAEQEANDADEVVGQDRPFGRSITFTLDGTSFVAQAFHLFEAKGRDVGTMSWSVYEEHNPKNKYSGAGGPDSYMVRIRRGNGAVVAELSTKHFTDEERAGRLARGEDEEEDRTLQAPPPLVQTVFDALHKAAEKLDVLHDFCLLRRSFDRLCLPVANEPREYVLNYVTLVFGMCQVAAHAAKDSLEMVDATVPGGWSTTLRLAIAGTPKNNAGGFTHVRLGSCIAATKKAARNEALLYLGKTNFTAELLRILAYGTVTQRGHAETMLLMKASGTIATTHSMYKQVARLARAAAPLVGSPSYGHGLTGTGAVGEAVPRLPVSGQRDLLSPCDQLIAKAIDDQVLTSGSDIVLAMKRSYPLLELAIKWDAEVMKDFAARLPRETLDFGRIVSPSAAEGSEPGGVGSGYVPIIGRSPINSLCAASRLLKELLEKMPDAARTTIPVSKMDGPVRLVKAEAKPLAVAPPAQPASIPAPIPVSAPVPLPSPTFAHSWSFSDAAPPAPTRTLQPLAVKKPLAPLSVGFGKSERSLSPPAMVVKKSNGLNTKAVEFSPKPKQQPGKALVGGVQPYDDAARRSAIYFDTSVF